MATSSDAALEQASGGEPLQEAARTADYTIIGRAQSGKTALIAAVLALARNSYHDYPGPEPQFLFELPQALGRRSEENHEALEMLRRQIVGSVHNGGVFEVTSRKTNSYELFVQLPGRWGGLFRGAQVKHRFRLVDGGGELLMPDRGVPADQSYRQQRQRHLEALMQARGVMLCMPVYPPAEFHSAQQLQVVMTWLQSERCCLERLVVSFTKYEHASAVYGRKAFEIAERRDFFIERVILQPQHQELLRCLAALSRKRTAGGVPVQIALTPVSVFGFVGRNGCANFDPWHPAPPLGGMLLQTEPPPGVTPKDTWRKDALYADQDARSRWVPYRIIEPFVYLVTGQGGSLTVPLAELLRGQ